MWLLISVYSILKGKISLLSLTIKSTKHLQPPQTGLQMTKAYITILYTLLFSGVTLPRYLNRVYYKWLLYMYIRLISQFKYLENKNSKYAEQVRAGILCIHFKQLKGAVSRDFFHSIFFHQTAPRGPSWGVLGPFRILSIYCRVISIWNGLSGVLNVVVSRDFIGPKVAWSDGP